jgi:hypothetical protein
MISKFKNIIRDQVKKNTLIKEISNLKAKILYLLLNDEQYTKYKFKSLHGEVLNLNNPRTFNEKLAVIKLNNRDSLTTKCSDKYTVREYVKEKLSDNILVPLFGVYERAEEIDFDVLPDSFVLKANHGSGYTIVCRDKLKMDKKETIKKLNKWISQNYFIYSREWQYKNISPKIVCEELLSGSEGQIPEDYRFFCFDGEPKFIAVDLESVDEKGNKKSHYFRNIYDTDWNMLDFRIGHENNREIVLEKPKELEKMLEYARILSEDFKHARIDFFYINNKIYFGEITFCHSGGMQKVYPEEYSIRLGDLIKI